MHPHQPNNRASAAGLDRQHALERITALAQSGKWDEAIAVTDRWVKPGSRDAQFMRARAVLEDHAQRFVLALQWATAAEAIESHPDTLHMLGRAAANAGQTDEALKRFRRVLEMVPGNTATRLLMAQVLESAVRADEASEVLEPLLAEVRGKDARLQAQVQHLRAAVLVHRKRDGEAVELLDT